MKKILSALMQNSTLRNALGKRIKRLRKEEKLTQKQLAKEIGTSPAQLNKYEGGFNAPPVERLLLLAEVFDCSVDYLITGSDEISGAPLNNQRLAHRFKVIDELELKEKEIIITVLDAMITKSKMDSTRTELSKANI